MTDMDSRHLRCWLDTEQEGQDDLAELAFKKLMTGLPGVELEPGFVERAVGAAWRARARRRLVARLARVTAVVLVAAVSVAIVYGLGVFFAAAVVRVMVVVAHGLVWLATAVGDGFRWWAVAERVGAGVAQTVMSPRTTALVAAIELMGMIAIYAFQRALRDGPHDSEMET
jgi:hypothetical protein